MAGLLLSFICTSCVGRYFISPQKCFQEALARKPYDAVIVPGYPHEKDNWSRIVKARVYWSVYLYKNGFAKNIIYSGSSVYSPYIESEVMALYAIALGIPDKNIFMETKAEHSTENLYFSYKLAKKEGFDKIALASDPGQSSYLKGFAKKIHLNVDFIPILFDTLQVIKQIDPDIEEEKAFVKNFVPITERESLLKRLQGTRGRKVKQMIKKEKKERRVKRK